MNVTVDVGTGESEDEGAMGMGFAKPDDRIVTSFCVECNQKVRVTLGPRLDNTDAMAKIAEDARPPEGGNAIALT